MNDKPVLRNSLVVLTFLLILLATAAPVGAARAPKKPEVNVRVALTNIPDNTGFVSFGTTTPGVGPYKEFVIENKGTANLTIGSVTLPDGFRQHGSHSSTVQPGGLTKVGVQCAPGVPGTFTGTFSFTNNDADENPYNFTITCTVLADTPPEMSVVWERDLSLIPDDTGSISVTGSQGYGVEIEISVHNSGTSPLIISEPTLPPNFEFFELLGGTTITGSSIFIILCRGTTPGTFGGEVSFVTNDADENPYNFMVSCTIN